MPLHINLLSGTRYIVSWDYNLNRRIGTILYALPCVLCIKLFRFIRSSLQNETGTQRNIGLHSLFSFVPNLGGNNVVSSAKKGRQVYSFKVPMQHIATCRTNRNQFF